MKKEKNKRMMRFNRISKITETVTSRWLAAFLLVGVLVCLACSASGKKQVSGKVGKKGKKEKDMAGNPITGGPYEASSAVQVPGTDTVLFVDDSRPSEVLLMQVDQAGQQVGAVRSINTGVVVENPEGITCDGTRFYIVGSQSNPKRGEANAIARFIYKADTQSITNVEVIKDFRSLLLAQVADLKGDAAARGADGGLNVEGLAWDPQNQRLLLGLRSPIREGKALLLPLKLRDPNGAFTGDNMDFSQSKVIAVALGGQGVREVQFDKKMNAFLVISGAPENMEKGEFVLWQWDGTPNGTPVRKASLDPGMKPEGLTEFQHGDQRFLFIMGDASRYMRMDYESLM